MKKIFNLEVRVKYPPDPNLEKDYNVLDELHMARMIKADVKCWKV